MYDSELVNPEEPLHDLLGPVLDPHEVDPFEVAFFD